jgi:hypothetical protein
MDLGIQFNVIWEDPDVIQIRVSVWNGTFGWTPDISAGSKGLVGLPLNYLGSQKVYQTTAELFSVPSIQDWLAAVCACDFTAPTSLGMRTWIHKFSLIPGFTHLPPELPQSSPRLFRCRSRQPQSTPSLMNFAEWL